MMKLFLIECAILTLVVIATLIVSAAAKMPSSSTPAVIAAALVVLILAYLNGGIGTIGLDKPKGMWLLAGLTIIGFVGLFAAAGFAQTVMRSLGYPPNIEKLSFIRGDSRAFVGMLIIAWTSAAFGEEIVFRGFLQHRLANLGDAALGPTLVAVMVQAMLFGLGHAYQGLGGIVVTGVVGAMLGLITIAANGNLWPAILIHGFGDTFSLTMLYLKYA